jgi:hypothetical protein
MNSNNGSHKANTLFCPGIPGAGKTVIVINHLHKKIGNDPSIGIAYLYCNFRRQHEQKSTDLIVNILKQLVQKQPFIPDVVKKLHSHHKPGGTRPSPDEILSTLHYVTAFYLRTYIIIDALDECQISHEGRGKFLQESFNLQDWCECFCNLAVYPGDLKQVRQEYKT